MFWLTVLGFNPYYLILLLLGPSWWKESVAGAAYIVKYEVERKRIQEEARAKYWPKDRHPTDNFHQSGLTSYLTPSYCEFSRTNVLIRSHSSGPICFPRAHMMVTKSYRWVWGWGAIMCIVNAATGFPVLHLILNMHPSLKPWQNTTPVSLSSIAIPHICTHTAL